MFQKEDLAGGGRKEGVVEDSPGNVLVRPADIPAPPPLAGRLAGVFHIW